MEKKSVKEATPLVAKKQKKDKSGKRSKTGLIVGIVIAAVVVVAGVVAAIIVPVVLSMDYEGAQEKVEEASKAISEISSGACRKVGEDVDDEDASVEKYADNVEKCEETIKKIEESYNAVAEAKAIQKDEDLAADFEGVKVNYEKIAEGLKQYPAYYKAVHEFMHETKEASAMQEDDLLEFSDSDIERMAKPLKESGIETLVEKGEAFEKSFKEVRDTYKAYKEASEKYLNREIEYSDYRKAREAYSSARTDFRKNGRVSTYDDYGTEFNSNMRKYQSELSSLRKSIREKIDE